MWATIADLKTGPKAAHSTAPTETREGDGCGLPAPHAAFAGDCLQTSQPSIPNPTRSALHRCRQRHGLSRLQDIEDDKPKWQRFKRYPIGFSHIDIADVQTAGGKLYLFVGIARTSNVAVTQSGDKTDRRTVWEFLEHLLKAVTYRIHTILTDTDRTVLIRGINSTGWIQFAQPPRDVTPAWSCQMRFDMICEANEPPRAPAHQAEPPLTNGQVGTMSRTTKEATVRRFH